ncbi:hypothetical protein V9T40_013622, partial [Parthenolecanium corni]
MLDGRVLGGLSREEVRQQQTLKYTEDSRKFAEKQKEKEQKKREERWKRYSHVDVGRRLNSDDQEFETDLEFIRNQQQFTYESQSAEGLEWERERENSRAQRENRRREEKLKKYSHVTAGQQLGSFERTTGSGSEGGKRPRRNQQLQQSNYELQSAVNSEHVQQGKPGEWGAGKKNHSKMPPSKKLILKLSQNIFYPPKSAVKVSGQLDGFQRVNGDATVASPATLSSHID